LAYKKAEIIYLLTFRFCERFLRKGDRTVDQMVQAARSGKQNIIEGVEAAVTSKETELKLVNVARASLGELLEDYFDYLATRGFTVWEKDSEKALFVRKKSQEPEAGYETFREFVETRPDEVVANIAICLIHQCRYLLERFLKQREEAFKAGGGLRERLTNARIEARREQRLGGAG
jgi:four helix bundle suffix protein